MSFERKNWLNIWMLGALGLCAVHGSALFLARHPDVSAMYRAYYIDRSSDLPIWLAEGRPGVLPPIELGRLYPHATSDILLIGWSGIAPRHVWSLDHEARIFFAPPEHLDRDQSYEIVLQGTYLGDEQLIGVTIAGHPHAPQTYRAGEDIVVPLPEDAYEQNIIELHLDLPQARKPGSADQRVLAFALQSMVLRVAEP